MLEEKEVFREVIFFTLLLPSYIANFQIFRIIWISLSCKPVQEDSPFISFCLS